LTYLTTAITNAISRISTISWKAWYALWIKSRNRIHNGAARSQTQVPAAGLYRIYNIGSNNPVELARFIETIEQCTGKKAKKNLLPMQPGDVVATYANVDGLINRCWLRNPNPARAGH